MLLYNNVSCFTAAYVSCICIYVTVSILAVACPLSLEAVVCTVCIFLSLCYLYISKLVEAVTCMCLHS